ncbi:hypothetical protein ISO99_04975 [Staphylococcus sp. 18_1_E_LY]|uniref:Uncharacterized protein n=1 Tax=Staphylococcus lloydii TaxID=2781774 RepID=A0A7T1F9H1_9STAP|nr:hypothetical protein [Staphylococcus lloydii]MBF7019260.1 hypothetical protein [Staphylococcus lloydii]MBF7026988.1 hypothetical protein [Staphylococcus lloydii]QPM74635.1 hypothetical protein ISP08_09835 [Staphylococcus lloydii]
MNIKLSDKDIHVIFVSLDYLSKSTNLLENYDLWHEDEMQDSFAKDYYKLLQKLRNSNENN